LPALTFSLLWAIYFRAVVDRAHHSQPEAPKPLSNSSRYRAVALIDRDGTLIEEKEYLSRPEEVALLPRAARALKLMEEYGIARVVCTNQSGVARGMFGEEDVHRVHDHLAKLLAEEGTRWDAIYSSFSHPDSGNPRYRESLELRKPAPGMAREAIRDLGLEGLPVFSIGDRLSDVTFGRNAGGFGVLVKTGYGVEEQKRLAGESSQGLVAADVYDAVRIGLNEIFKSAYPADKIMRRKLVSPGQAAEIVRNRKGMGKKTVLANGCFDLLHGGHISFLENARAAGDALVLAVNSNESITRLKGKGRPIFDEASRLQLLAAFEAVDYLTVFYTDTADEVLEEIHPDIHAKGTDYKSDTVPERLTSKRLGIETVIAGAPKENSTRDIIEVVVERARAGTI